MARKDADKDMTEENPAQEHQPDGETPAESPDTAAEAGDADAELDARIEEAVAAALAEQADSVLRAHAEVQNMRRRCEQDVEKAHKFALERFSSDLLTVIDNLERALAAVADKDDEAIVPLREGVELTLKGFLETCEKFHIKQVNPEGEPFDPQRHQAMSMVPNPDVEPNTVVAVVQKGYTLNDRVIRPAMVMVSKAP